MRRQPLVSVVIPTYNRAGIICQTLDNVLEQTYANFELIVVDDGSTDDTLSKLRPYGNRIRVISQANAGPAVARNRGVEAARGEIIAFQDSDDLWKSTKLERQVALLEHFGRSVPCCLCSVFLGLVDGKEYTSFDHSMVRMRREEGLWLNVAEVLATRFVLFNQAVAIRREFFERVGGFDPELKYLEDYDLPLRLALEGPWAFIREPLVIYGHGSPESFSQAALKDPLALKECELKIYERLLARQGGWGPNEHARKHLMRREKIASRELQAMRREGPDSLVVRVMRKVLKEISRCHVAFYRRSPWFPQPNTLPVGAPISHHKRRRTCVSVAK
jgi:glycosyltransferase involved in cell wall biosynthesis